MVFKEYSFYEYNQKLFIILLELCNKQINFIIYIIEFVDLYIRIHSLSIVQIRNIWIDYGFT
ncbi:hypothetical protein CNEO4_560017 [Clostridium neonatale]|uniref:Uncharacterized protein n=1 Tax=Clostridium neonatale TaxID=137838 RepID=A0AA86MNZ3_9CLOT|nr:hypothetical protein CNEO_42610 [Clostridium neonatale]CAG9717800.1 hypothetical protein CNEO_520038 [Clostridium neonatale]CAI3647717.1 hypothetical protein CNEO4_570016 [Clostridium neonatale]CAI3663739.1 hypothetical protein CNEO3_890003 [Clostridium neonatale]CAI3669449.1 hypothetical protein CNEO4_570017 [Clostridium neonatale]